MTKRTDKNFDDSAGSADDDSSNRITHAQWLAANPFPKDATPDEVDKWMEANPGLVKEQPPDDEAVTTVRFLGKKAAEARKKRNK